MRYKDHTANSLMLSELDLSRDELISLIFSFLAGGKEDKEDFIQIMNFSRMLPNSKHKDLFVDVMTIDMSYDLALEFVSIFYLIIGEHPFVEFVNNKYDAAKDKSNSLALIGKVFKAAQKDVFLKKLLKNKIASMSV